MLEKFPSPDALDAIVPISRFNKGEASRIFEEVKKSGFKIVVKNNSPACVLLEPENYKRLMEKLEDAELVLEADRRISATDKNSYLTEAKLLEHLGISEADIDGAPEVEIG